MRSNSETVLAAYRAFNSADKLALDEIFAEDMDWHAPGVGRLSRIARGRDEVFALFAEYAAADSFSAEPVLVAEAPNGQVIALQHNIATLGAKRIEADGCVLFTVRDGRIVEGREFYSNSGDWADFFG